MHIAARLTLALVLSMSASLAQAQLPVNITGAISSDDALEPAVYSFQVAEDGDYSVQVVDFGAMGSNIPRAASIDFLLTETGAATPTLTANAELDTLQTLTAGDYTVVLIADPEEMAGVAAIAVLIEPAAGGTPVLDEVAAFSDSALIENPAVIEFGFTAASNGGHDLTVTDLGFADALAAVQTLAVRRSDGSVLGTLLAPGTVNLNLTASDEVDVTIIATRNADTDRSLLSYSVVDTVTAEVIIDNLEALGDASEVQERTFDELAPGQPLTLTITDLAEPAALSGLKTLAVSGTSVAGNVINGSGSTTVTPATASLTVLIAADPASTGTVGLALDDGGDPIVDTVVNIVPAGTLGDVAVIGASFDVAGDGEVAITVADFVFPGPLESLSMAVVFDGAIVASLDAAGSTTFEAIAGEHFLSVVGTAAGGSAAAFGVTVTEGAAVLVEETAVAGNAAFSADFTVDTAQELRVVVSDLAFPERFAELRAVIARGATLFGTILGGSLFEFDAAAGDYELLVLAEPGATTGYAVGSANVDTAPDAPTVTLTASASSVTVGDGVTLTWSSANAAVCTATGSWSGVRDTSGEEEIATLSSDSSYTLSCAGDGGMANASVTVRVTAVPASSSGGGAPAWPFLGLLALASMIRRRTGAA